MRKSQGMSKDNRKAERRKLNRLTKRALVDKVSDLRDLIDQLQHFYTLPIKRVSVDEEMEIRDAPGFISVECYAHVRPAKNEIGCTMDAPYRTLKLNACDN